MKGQNKKEFELYVLNNYDAGHDVDGRLTIMLSNKIAHFYKLPPEMQQGVILAYYDTTNLKLLINYNNQADWFYFIRKGKRLMSSKNGYSTRSKAIEEALEQADKLRNEQLN